MWRPQRCSLDLWLGPQAPEGREKNWLATPPGRGYFAILRLYGPVAEALNRTWKPGDWPTYAPFGFGGYRFPAVGNQAYR